MSSPPPSDDDNAYDDVKPDKSDDEGDTAAALLAPSSGAEQRRSPSPPATAAAVADDEEDEDDEDDDDEDDDEEDEEDEDDEDEGQSRKRAKKRKTSRHRNRFIEDEAEVDDEDEDLDEEDEEYARETEEFIDQDAQLEAEGGVDARHVQRDHQRLERRRRQDEDLDAEQIAASFRERFQAQQARAYRGDTDADNLPQSMLVPSVEDPKLWQVRAKPGREKQLVFSIMRKSLDLEYTDRPLEIFSAFQRDSLPGLLYVEAKTRSAVEVAVQGLVGVYVSRGIQLVPIDEMASLLKLTKKRVEILPGSWVRIKRGRYQGDLAQVLDITENGEEVGLKFIPRIDLSPADPGADGDKKRKKGTMTGTVASRPPAKFFSAEEVSKAYGARALVKRGDQYVFMQDTYVGGFIEKDLKVTAIETDNVQPTMDELELFTGAQEGTEDYAKLQEQAKQSAMAVLQPGDVVEVSHDQNKGAVGEVVTIAEGIVTLRRTTGENAGAELVVRGEFVKKLFRTGEHVKVMAGKNLDETGLVLKVEGDRVTFMSDLSKEEVTVFGKDLRVASEVGSGLNSVGQHELHDLIPIGSNNYGVIYRTERDAFHVLDASGKSLTIRPELVGSVPGGNRDANTYDRNGTPLRKGESAVEVGGETRSGTIIAIRGLSVFLYNRDIAAHEGVFVASPRELQSSASKTARVQTDLTKLNPEIAQHVPAGSGIGLQGRRFRDPLIDTPVVVVRGVNKSRVGIIKDVNGDICRVELQSTNNTITVKKSALLKKDPRTGATAPLPETVSASAGAGVPYRRPASEAPMGPPGTVNPYASSFAGATPNPYAGDGGRTPAFAAGRTPNPYGAGGATPGGAWGFGGATPAPPPSGGRTPAYGMVHGGRTPAAGGLQGGRTPAASGIQGGRTPYAGAFDGGRTPAYAGAAAGGRTPAYGMGMAGAGGRTPAYGGAGGRTPAYGGGYGGENVAFGSAGAATPYGGGGTAYQDGPSKGYGGQSYGEPWNSAPTPGAGPQSAPTPGMYGSAPTPGPTPGAGPYSAPTPAAGEPYSAPTPGAGPYSAPTPAAGSWGN